MTQLRSSSSLSARALPLVLPSLALFAMACGGGDGQADAAVGPDAPSASGDAGRDAGGSGGGCAAPRTVALTLGAPMTVTGDTTGGPPGELELGPACRNPAVATVPPQEVLAIEVPGTGDVGIAFDLTNGTASTFDTVVEVRTACETTPTDAESCFDDPAQDEHRSAGAFMATGGSTIYLVVSGFEMGAAGTVSSGRYSMQIQADPNAAPTLTDATARRVDDDRLEIFATGMDADANAYGVGFELLAADGSTVPLDAAHPEDLGPYFYYFDVDVTGTSFTAQLVTAPGSADYDGIGAASRLRVFSFDAYGARSATRDVTIDMVTEVAFGGSCDATHICRAADLCEGGVCVASPATIALCGAASSVTLEAPTGAMPTVSAQSVMLAAGAGVSTGLTCDYTADGAEKVLAVTIPDGMFDLIATTNLPANSPDLDTIVYVRTACENESSELVCDDDYAGAPDGDYRSYALVQNVPAGTAFVFVDGYAPFDATTTVALELRLRPVLATGATCDPAGEQNRCAGGACSAAGACP